MTQNNISVSYRIRFGREGEYELVHTPENSQLLQSDIIPRRLLTSTIARTKDQLTSTQPTLSKDRITTLHFYYERRISKMRASGRPLKSLSFLIARRQGYVRRIK